VLSLKNLFCFLEEGVSFRMRVFIAQLGKMFQSLFLGGVEVFWDLDLGADMEISPSTTRDGRNTLSPDPEDLVGRSSGWDFEGHFSVEAGDADLGAQSELGKGDGDIAKEVMFLPFKDGVRSYGENHVEIPGRTAP